MRWVPPCRSKPSLIRLEKLSRSCAGEVGNAGNPTNPKMHNKMTSVMKTAFHLRLESMVSFRPREHPENFQLSSLPGRLSFLAFRLNPRHRGAGHSHFHLLGDAQWYRITV